MKSCWYEETGAAAQVLRVGELDTPSAGAGEVLVDVYRSGVNTTDLKRRAGARGGMPFLKVVPHFDAAGIISAVGDGVDAARLGQRVWVWEGQYRKPMGTCADQVVVPASRAMPLPEAMSFAEGGAIGVPALTAAHALKLGGDLAGATVLVTGGAGAVGNFAIQIARDMGARVITTVSGERKAKDAIAAGAAHTIYYRSTNVGDEVMRVTDGKGVQHMVDLDLGGHLADAHRYVARCGSIAAYGSVSNAEPVFPFPKYMYRNISIHGVAIFDVPEQAKLAAAARVSDMAEAGTLTCRVDETFDLDETARAHERLESGQAIGSVQVRIRN